MTASSAERIVFALRYAGVPLHALNLDFFTDNEAAIIKAGFAMPISELFDRESRNLPITDRSNVVRIEDYDTDYQRKLNAVSAEIAAPQLNGAA